MRLDGAQHLAKGGGVGRPPVPWSTRDVWLGVIAAAVITGAATGLLFSLRSLSLGLGLDLWVALIPTLFELLFLIPVWWFTVRKYHASPKTLGFVSFKFSVVGVGVGLLFAFFIFNGLYASLLNAFGLQVQTDLTPVLRRLSTPWPLFITVVLVAPVVEETFFRGFVFGGLRSRYDWRWAAAISAALFAAAHLQITFFIPAFILGYLFAYLYRRSNSIWPGIIIHVVVNAFALTVTYAWM
jgi:membrane protease YdiL (CAAX protease family)